MKLFVGAVALVLSLAIGFGYLKFDELTRPLPAPKLDTAKYWGPGEGSKYKADESIKPFSVRITVQEIRDLRTQLNRTLKLTEPLEGTNFEYGFNSKALADIVTYWRDDYLPRWTEREQFLNGLPQYTTEIQGLRIHFIHAKPSAKDLKGKKVLPLLLLHGWPGSVREFYDIIPMLTGAASINDYVYEVVAPSLIGYGWSQAPAKRGFDSAHNAVVMRNLMLRLGYQKFLVQGGDWGSFIGSNIATLFPENVLGYHSNMCVMHTPLFFMKQLAAGYFPEKFIPSRDFYDHHFPFLDKIKLLLPEMGSFHLQSTKPDTIGIALDHSPIGLAAYILEKFQSTAGPALNHKFDALAAVYTLDAVLDNVMIYYLTHTATSSGRLYAENISKEFQELQLDRVQTQVPMGCARFKHDLTSALDWQLRDKFPNLVHSTYFNQGGHFAALEVPVLLYTDFVEFVIKLNL